MANDVVTFTLSNDDGREVLVKPSFPGEVGEALSQLIWSELMLLGTDLQVEIYLVAVDRASVRIAFRAFLRKADQIAADHKALIETTAASVALLSAAVSGALSLGVKLHVLSPQSPTENSVMSPQHAEGTVNPIAETALSQMLSAARTSGADKVTISFPDHGTFLLHNDAPREPSLLGSDAPSYKIATCPAEGRLTLIPGTLRVQLPNGELAVLGMGEMFSDDSITKVVVEWRSSKSVPEVGSEIVFRGSIKPVADAGYRPADPVTTPFRSTGLVLVVEGIQAYE